MKKIIFYKCIKNDPQNNKIKSGDSYAVFLKDQEILGLGEDEIIVRNFGRTKKEYLVNHKHICIKCNRPNNGILPKDRPNGTGYYVCLCNWGQHN